MCSCPLARILTESISEGSCTCTLTVASCTIIRRMIITANVKPYKKRDTESGRKTDTHPNDRVMDDRLLREDGQVTV